MSRQRPSRLTDFWRGFNAFCDTWRLLGLVTWDLPKTDGPKWSEDYPGKPVGLDGAESLDTPWHFPVEGQDGLGRMLTERHQQRAADHGFVDQSRWATYAHFLTIDFWERVLRSRYAERERPKAEVSRILADERRRSRRSGPLSSMSISGVRFSAASPNAVKASSRRTRPRSYTLSSPCARIARARTGARTGRTAKVGT